MSSHPVRQDVQPADEYSYRRDLSLRELAPAIGVGIGVGLLAFYVARLFFERTPLRIPEDVPRRRRTSGG
jgi:H+/Cl- antiporter ClcA